MNMGYGCDQIQDTSTAWRYNSGMPTSWILSSEKPKVKGHAITARTSPSADSNGCDPSPPQEAQQVSEAIENTARKPALPIWLFSEETQRLEGDQETEQEDIVPAIFLPSLV